MLVAIQSLSTTVIGDHLSIQLNWLHSEKQTYLVLITQQTG